MKDFIRNASIAILASAGALAAAAESPNDDEAVRSKTVTFDPAATVTDVGAQQLYERLRSAARDVCLDDGYPRVLMSKDAVDCAAEAIDRAVRDVNQSALTDVHLREGEVNVGAIEDGGSR